MKGDIQEMLVGREPKVGQTLFIAIDGHAGSGKSVLANLLAEKLQAEIVRTDDFASWENPFDWWPLVIERVFQSIQNGAKTLNYPCSKWWENHNPEPVINQPVTKVMILEGVGSLRKEFRPYVSFGIFVTAPVELCLQRGVERDLEIGKSKEELLQMWTNWFEQEEKYLAAHDPQSFADLLLDGTHPFETQLK